MGVQEHVHAVSERGQTLLRCDKCGRSEPLDKQAWQDCFNTFLARHYHLEIDDPGDD